MEAEATSSPLLFRLKVVVTSNSSCLGQTLTILSFTGGYLLSLKFTLTRSVPNKYVRINTKTGYIGVPIYMLVLDL